MDQIKLSDSLFTAADLQGKESQCSAGELRDLGALAQTLESQLGASEKALKTMAGEG